MSDTDRNLETYRVSRNPSNYKVLVRSDITLEDYQKITPPEQWKLLEKYATALKGKTVVFINPTMEGGGVAMLRPPMVHVLHLFGVKAYWYVMEGRRHSGDPNPFLFTKLMHNISQRRTEERITQEGKDIHQNWCSENALVLTKQRPIRNADIIVIDDPQPAPLKKHIEEVNPDALWVWRNHIDTSQELMSDPSTPQAEVATYIMDECGIRNSHAIIAHPVDAFIHPGMGNKTYFAPATTDPFDDLNKPLTDKEVVEGIAFINEEIKLKDWTLDAVDQQSVIDPHRQHIALIARFDESKGMDIAMEIGVRARRILRERGVSENELPQVILAGNGSVDDPSGGFMYEKVLAERRKYLDDKADIIVVRLKHNYKAINALMHQTPGFKEGEAPAIVAMQTSLAEGCETRISDWIGHGVPVVVSNRGGMSLQVEENVSGLVLDFNREDYDVERGATYIADLLADQKKYNDIRKKTLHRADEFNEKEFTTTANITRFARVFYNILNGIPADKVWEITKMAKKK